ncbi:SUMF1/EgtB/PvdO family nonheme iron enzyme [Nostoc sp. CENA67]|uniref:SUMF1/EgtB/PvdO family nonheme iron enzyme n=1 Tax=Amazonocrinis nigriterrae CENA67 TaxID=2794033 RepID=A0A8J7HR12_9NOST|nr:SUMF1/EgtB/PvdO family nonheme iron enzyme [Amazonocrinis nigriterrae]MBH8564087.1 SUMF1/EgtB/PvdO family nonheme iron enzyme [Amazonocrinis nigriterrae CENA67]
MAKLALLIGISEYDEPTLTALPKAVNDVEAMQRVLVNPEMGGFAADDVTVLENPERQVMEDAIYQLYDNRQKDDLLLLYFSGHGVKVENGDFYFSTRRTRKNPQGNLILPSAVAATNVHNWMNNTRSRRLVVILDCCFSGAFARGLTAKDGGTIDLQQHLGGEGRAILTASTSMQYAFESDDLNLSIYTHYLVEGIEKGAADKDGDGLISVDELHSYAKSKVQEAAPAMTPEFYPVKDGYRIFLAKSPKDDPKLKYRQEAEQRAKLNQGSFSVFALELLESQRIKWGLSQDEAIAIQEEVLQPYREYQRKRNQYEQALILAVNQETYPFTEGVQQDLQDYQQHLALRDEDIELIKQRVLAPKQAEYERQQQEAERLRQELKTVESQRQQERESAKTVFPPSFPTQTFEFDTATLTVKSSGFLGIGKKTYEINRSQGRAEFFIEDLGNGVVLEMVAIPGGKFLMGSPENEPERYSFESPQHTVTIQPFFMGKFPVTQSQWAAVAALGKVNIDLDRDPSYFKGANRPVESVSLNQAVEFCHRLSQKTGEIYRLPSEAEWEYACRAGTTTPFYFGETITTDLANYRGTDWDYQGKVYPGNYAQGPKGEYREQTTDVGKFPANPFGLFDMHGNIWEWCQDEWHNNYNNAPVDGTAWSIDNSSNNNRLLRGGSWDFNPWGCRSANRFYNARVNRSLNVGFRVVVVRRST